jgi:multicomponent Na+:H+ antiporter subunit B
MYKKILIGIVIGALSYIFYNLYSIYQPKDELTGVAKYYATNGAEEIGAANLVTSIVVTYRGFDTLGEVTILFLTAAIISFFLKLSMDEEAKQIKYSNTTEILTTTSSILVPIIFMFGIYVFINGHLTPGGGFQGGSIIATGVALMILSNPNVHINHQIINWVESISGMGYVFIGVLGIILAGGFLDNRVFGLGEFGTLFSAGIIPIIYSFIGLKVGAEISNILNKYQKSRKAN